MVKGSIVRIMSDKKCIVMRLPHNYDYINLHCKCENENRKYPDLLLFLQQGKNSRGTDHFTSWEKIKKEEIFRGTDHRACFL